MDLLCAAPSRKRQFTKMHRWTCATAPKQLQAMPQMEAPGSSKTFPNTTSRFDRTLLQAVARNTPAGDALRVCARGQQARLHAARLVAQQTSQHREHQLVVVAACGHELRKLARHRPLHRLFLCAHEALYHDPAGLQREHDQCDSPRCAFDRDLLLRHSCSEMP